VLTEKLGFGDEHAREACTLLAGLATTRPGSPSAVEAITGDPADDLILACAVEVGAEVLATGDRKHLLPLGEHHGVRRLTPQATLAELRTRD
jgi:predicted nucleic acid-binding protein